MAQRLITAAGLIALLMVLMYFGGWVMAVAIGICICIAIREEFMALKGAGHTVTSSPTWIGLVVGTVLVLTMGTKAILPVVLFIVFGTMLSVIFRKEPKLENCVMSLLPILTIALPGFCLTDMALVQPKEMQVILLCLVFVVPVLCDTLAFLVGSRLRGMKLCPAVSPNKTVSGAIGGMVGAVLGAVLVGIVAVAACPAEVRPLLPAWWQYLLLGLLGGIVSQIGDLFASMVKRYCGVKDFSNLFPGHGGMLDRIDSVLFMAVLVFCFRLLTR